jgi:hypothetical protein
MSASFISKSSSSLSIFSLFYKEKGAFALARVSALSFMIEPGK